MNKSIYLAWRNNFLKALEALPKDQFKEKASYDELELEKNIARNTKYLKRISNFAQELGMDVNSIDLSDSNNFLDVKKKIRKKLKSPDDFLVGIVYSYIRLSHLIDKQKDKLASIKFINQEDRLSRPKKRRQLPAMMALWIYVGFDLFSGREKSEEGYKLMLIFLESDVQFSGQLARLFGSKEEARKRLYNRFSKNGHNKLKNISHRVTELKYFYKRIFLSSNRRVIIQSLSQCRSGDLKKFELLRMKLRNKIINC